MSTEQAPQKLFEALQCVAPVAHLWVADTPETGRLYGCKLKGFDGIVWHPVVGNENEFPAVASRIVKAFKGHEHG